jgi:hypothetical protein
LKLASEMCVVLYLQSPARGLARSSPIPPGADRALIVEGAVDGSINRSGSRAGSMSKPESTSQSTASARASTALLR